MKQQSILALVFCVILAVMLQGAVSLPPDFFRNGRGNVMRVPPHKKATADLELLEAACGFCGKFFYEAAVEYECKKGVATRREDCVELYVKALENAVERRG